MFLVQMPTILQKLLVPLRTTLTQMSTGAIGSVFGGATKIDLSKC